MQSCLLLHVAPYVDGIVAGTLSFQCVKVITGELLPLRALAWFLLLIYRDVSIGRSSLNQRTPVSVSSIVPEAPCNHQ